MEKIITRFCVLLRSAGIRVSLSEAADAMNALSLWGIEDRERVYSVLKATLLKDEMQKDIFDTVWSIFFMQKAKPGLAESHLQCTGNTRTEFSSAGMNGQARRFCGLLAERRGREAAEEISAAAENTDPGELTSEELAEQLKTTLGWFMTRYALKSSGDTEGLVLLNRLEHYLTLRCRERIIGERGERGIREELTAGNRRSRDFAALSEEQIKLMEKEIAKLGRQLAGRYTYRMKPSKNGIPDMRRLLKETARKGHLPSRIPMQNKRKDSPNLTVLCDISGSMGIYSSFCLQLVCAMKRRFRSVRVFLFIDNIVETGLDTENKSAAEAVSGAIERAYPKRTGRSKEQCTTTGVSDYGKALEAFRLKYEPSLEKDTTLVIVGDARTNWFPPKPEELRDLSLKCAKVIWLNPEPSSLWNTEDSAVSFYEPYCDIVAECGSMEQLKAAVSKI